jgi:alpha-1,2-mannosyltransferase
MSGFGHSADVEQGVLPARSECPQLPEFPPAAPWRLMPSRPWKLLRPDLLLALCLLGIAVGKRLVLLPAWTQLDLDVYRRGAAALAGGRPIYDLVPGQYPFTYPPFAAILMLPLGLVSRSAAIAAIAILSLAAFALICSITFRRLQVDRRLGWFLALGAISLQPVAKTFELGQVNLTLMALVMLDCLVVPPRYRGIGIGIAAAIKIVPGIFVLYFVLRRDWRAVAQSGGVFAATLLVSVIVIPHETISYWTHLMSAAARTGDTISSVNQSLPAVVARLMHDRYPPAVVVALVSLSGIAIAALAARKQLALGHDLAALVCIAIGGLLASPVSWSHHYVWAAPALIILFLEKSTVAAAVGAAIFYVAPWQNIPFDNGLELTYGPWELFVSAAYPLAAVLWLASRLFARSATTVTPPDPREQVAQPRGELVQGPNKSGMPPAQVSGRHT